MSRAWFLSVVLFCGLVQARAQSTRPVHLVKVGSIAGDSGVFAILNGLVTMYSNGSLRTQNGADARWNLAGPGTKYLSFSINRGKMTATDDKVPLAATHGFAMCDPLNQINLANTADEDLLRLLPKNAKIKSVDGANTPLAFVVYSTGTSTIRYDTDVALVRHTDGGKYTLLSSAIVSHEGSYCGMEEIGADYRALLIDEPSGSSDFSVVYLFGAVR